MSTDRMIVIIEIIVIAVLAGVNIWMMIRRRKKVDRNNIEGVQFREMELNKKLENQAGASVDRGQLRPYEEKYASVAKEPATAEIGLRVEIKVDTPISSKKYLTTIGERIRIGTDPSNDLILDSQLAAGKEALLIREKKTLLFQKLDGGSAIYVERGRARRTLDERPIRVHSQDCFHIQDVTVQISFV